MSPYRTHRICRFESLENRELFASDLTLLADVNSDPNVQGMAVRELTKLGSEVYFLSENPTVGEELWRFNAGVPKLVKNINQGSRSADIRDLTVLGDKLIFSAEDQEHGNEIWGSDGTESGTQLLRDISVGANSNPRAIKAVGNQALFFAYGRTFNGILWKTDGTPEGTKLVKSIESNSQSFHNVNLTSVVLGNKLFFVFDDEVHGAELWESDGTAEGTHIAFEFADGPASIQPNGLVSLGNVMFMETNQGIFASDGTLGGTVKVSSKPLSLEKARVYQNKLYFTDNGNTLWVSNGTVQGTNAVKTLEGSIHDIDVTGNGLVMRTADTFPYSIVTSDGTSDGTSRLDDENFFGRYRTFNIFPAPTGFYFLSFQSQQLFYSNGTTASTKLVKEFTFPISISRGGSVFVNGKLFFPVNRDSVDLLWVSDGTQPGTNSVNEVRLQTQSSIPVVQVSAGNLAYILTFNRTGVDGSLQLWRSDGTPDGTRRLLNDSFWPSHISSFGNKLAFFTSPQSDRSIGYRIVKRLWTSDGSDEGTKVLFDFTEPVDERVVADSFQVGDKLYFWLNRKTQQTSSSEFWSTDGTTQGTVRIALLPDAATPLSTSPATPAIAGGLVYFKTTHENDLGISSQTLWRTDGSLDGTFSIQSFAPYDYPKLIGTIDSTLYFSSGANDVFSIYKTDGTALGTVKVIDSIAGFAKATIFKKRIIITTDTGIASYDPALGGSSTLLASVVIRSDIGPNFAEVGDKLYFTAETDQELWVTDGSASGTHAIRNINLAGRGARPQELTNINGTLYFSAIDGVHGRELWKSNGTEATTQFVADATGDAGDGVPTPFRAGTKVLVIANSNEYGREIYAVEKSVSILSLLGAAIDENNAVDAVVGDLSLSNFAGLGLAFSLVGDQPDNSKFKIVGNQLLARESFNYEVKNSYQVRIQARSAFETLMEKEILLLVNNVNEPPSIELDRTKIAENAAIGTVVGNLAAIDPDANSNYTFSLVDGAGALDNAGFEIVSGVLKSRQSFDFETTPTRRVVVKAREQAGDAYLRTFTIQVTNVNEGPVTGGADNAKIDRHFTTALNVTANDSSREGIINPSTVSLVRQPTHGQARVLADGKIEFTPDQSYVGADSLEYRVSDEDGLTSNPILVSLDILTSFHRNPTNALDVDEDGVISPLDVLKMINDLNANGARKLPQRNGLSGPYLDVDGDGGIGPLDILIVVNYINSHSGSGTGEGESLDLKRDAHDIVFQMLDWESVKQRRGGQRSIPFRGSDQ